MERSSREWDVSKELEGGSHYMHKDTDTVQDKPRKRKTKSDWAAKS
jgi:hypothetical protein